MTVEQVRRIAWKPLEPLALGEPSENGSLAALDALRKEWDRRLSEQSEEERTRIRQRSLRRLSVETGFLERLYDIDWGLTLTLVAEGFARDVLERAGGKLDDHTLATLQAQRDSLDLVLDFVRDGRKLGPFFIRELHAALTRTQQTYVVTDSLGRVVETAMVHGEWKSQPNHVLRSDHSLLEYAPPEQVASEVDRLVGLYSDLEASGRHPIIIAAWLHHRFVQIHPFADGNGRVARALTLLVLEKHRYAPLVVDRFHREKYLEALEAANEGRLDALVRLFVQLEQSALVSELERPSPQAVSAGAAVDVARTLASQLAERRRRKETEIQSALIARAEAVLGRMDNWFRGKHKEIRSEFLAKGLKEIRVLVGGAKTPDAKATWWRRQISESAREAGHSPDFSFFTGWVNLTIQAEDIEVRFVASLHGASGEDAGVMAVTTFAELQHHGDAEGVDDRTIVRTTIDAFRFVHTERIEDIDKRGGELEELLDDGLTVALTRLFQELF